MCRITSDICAQGILRQVPDPGNWTPSIYNQTSNVQEQLTCEKDDNGWLCRAPLEHFGKYGEVADVDARCSSHANPHEGVEQGWYSPSDYEDVPREDMG